MGIYLGSLSLLFAVTILGILLPVELRVGFSETVWEGLYKLIKCAANVRHCCCLYIEFK